MQDIKTNQDERLQSDNNNEENNNSDIIKENPNPKLKDESLVIIEQLRGKTEEGDLEQYLKKSFGGYTRDSVLEYFGNLRRQQHTSSETFYKNIQTLHDEKEALTETNRKLKARLLKVETDYENFSQTILLNKMEGSDFSVKEFIDLKVKLTALKEELKKSNNDNRLLTGKLDSLEKANDDLKTQIEQGKEAINAQKRLVISEKIETKKQFDLASDYLAQLEAEMDQNKYLKSLVETGELSKLKVKVSDLTEQISSMSEVNQKLVVDIENKERRAEALYAQIETMKTTFSSLTGDIEEINGLNEKLINANKALSDQLEEEFQKTINLVRERSDINTDKFTLMNKLSDANMNITMLEQRLEKDKKIEALGEAYREINKLRTEE